MTLTGPDVSNHQGALNFAALHTDFLLAKATQGTGFVDPWFANNKNGARGLGLPFGAYHFAQATDPAAEAAFFLAHADHRPGELLVLDWETSHPDPDGWCATFCNALKAAGVVPVVYMNSSTARGTWDATRATGAVLWVAQYGVNDGWPHTPPNVGAWGGYPMWQYTSAGSLPGIGGRCDVNTFYGDASTWHALGGVGDVSNVLSALGAVPDAPGSLTTNAPTPAVQEDDMRIISAPLPWDTSKRQQVWVTPSGGAGTLDDATAAVLRQTWPSHDLGSWTDLETEVREAWARQAAAQGRDLTQADVQAAVEAGVRNVLHGA